MKKGILFDLDGTLWDACSVIAASYNEYLRMNAPDLAKKVTEDDLRRTCGLPMNALGDQIFGYVPCPRRQRILEECFVFEVEYLKNHGGKVYSGVLETLERLHEKYTLCIVSNCQAGYIEDFFLTSGAGQYIDDFEEYGRTGLMKDENIRLVCSRNGLDKAVYVGDTQGDFDSAAAAGVPFILASYGFGNVKEPVPEIKTISELPEAADRLLR